MLRLLATTCLVMFGFGCLPGNGSGGGDGAAASSSPEVTATGSPAPAGDAKPGSMRTLSGRHFRWEAPSHWLLVDPESPLGADAESAIAELPETVREEVLRVHREAATEVVLTGLPVEADSRIAVTSDCGTVWSHGPSDWTREMRDTLRREGNVVGVLGAIASIDQVPYPVLEVRDGADVHFSVHPVSRDGCTYAMSVQGVDREAALSEFVLFSDGLQLGRVGGESSLPEGSLVPAGWNEIVGREFRAALPTDWFYNDSTVPLSAEQLELIGDLPADVAEVLLEDQGFGDIEMMYLGLPADFDPFLTVTSLCDVPDDVTPSEWVELSTDGRAVAEAEVSLTGLTVTVDGRSHDVFRVEYPKAPQFDVYPLSADGCGFAFAVSTPVAGETRWMVMDFVAFMQTVEFAGQ